MTTIVRNQKLPNSHIGGARVEANRDAAYTAARERQIARRRQNVKPATGMDELFGAKTADVTGIIPSVIGKAGTTGATKREANKGASRRKLKTQRIADAARVVVNGLGAIIKIRDSAEAAADPELMKLATDPKLMAVVKKFVTELGRAANDLIAENEAAQGASNDPAVVGMDAAAMRGFDQAVYDSLDTDSKVQYEMALKRVYEYRVQVRYGNAGVTGDAVYEGLERKK